MGVLERIKDIEAEMAKTQKNKATEYHLGTLKAKLAKLKKEQIDAATKGSGGTGEGFDVSKTGVARVGMVGFPSVGKSIGRLPSSGWGRGLAPRIPYLRGRLLNAHEAAGVRQP